MATINAVGYLRKALTGLDALPDSFDPDSTQPDSVSTVVFLRAYLRGSS